jgi:O-acetylserine/cysteine efflux transporter
MIFLMRPFHLFLAILITAIWGFNFIMLHLGLKQVSPQTLGFIRFFGSAFPAIFFVKKPNIPFRIILLYGFIMFALQFSFLFSGLATGVPAGIASLIMQTHVFFTIFLGLLFLNEEPNKWQIVGGIISFCGIGLIGLHLNKEIPISGLLLILGAALTWGIGNLITKKIKGVNMLSLVVWGSFVAWPPLLVSTIFIDGFDNLVYTFEHLSWVSVISIFYIIYLSTLIGFAVWSNLLARYPTAVVAPFTLLVPIFGMFCSSLFLGEPLQHWKLYAAALVISGLCINLLAPRLMLKIGKVSTEAVT